MGDTVDEERRKGEKHGQGSRGVDECRDFSKGLRGTR